MLTTTVLDVGGVHWATTGAVIESTLLRRPGGVSSVQANTVNNTATVTYDPAATSVADLSQWLRDCGFHCQGRSVPAHVCDRWPNPVAPRRYRRMR